MIVTTRKMRPVNSQLVFIYCSPSSELFVEPIITSSTSRFERIPSRHDPLQLFECSVPWQRDISTEHACLSKKRASSRRGRLMQFRKPLTGGSPSTHPRARRCHNKAARNISITARAKLRQRAVGLQHTETRDASRPAPGAALVPI